MRLFSASILSLLACSTFLPVAFAEGTPVSRRDAFVMMWQTIKRPADPATKQRYDDVKPGDPGFLEISFGRRRNILPDDIDNFRPNDPLVMSDALLWLFRTRNIEYIDPESWEGVSEIIDPEDVPFVLKKYPITTKSMDSTLMVEELSAMITDLDTKLKTEDHEVSLYSEKFQGKGTAFGESFDMHQLTAAHRSFPYNTLVKVTNLTNGKSIVVRINDRGPYMPKGRYRDMDMSLASFLAISPREVGHTRVTFERLGDVSLVDTSGITSSSGTVAPASCTSGDLGVQQRLGWMTALTKGVPRSFQNGKQLVLSSDKFFFVDSVTYPDGTKALLRQWVTPKDEQFLFTPAVDGTYTFVIRAKNGKNREMKMVVGNRC
jgi:rare lipoprotein A (peptidoglycan hydrolase)